MSVRAAVRTALPALATLPSKPSVHFLFFPSEQLFPLNSKAFLKSILLFLNTFKVGENFLLTVPIKST